MQKKSLIKWLGYALAATLCFAGCDSGGSDPDIVAGGGGIGTTGGGGTTTTTTTSTTGFGITGGSMTGAFGGTGTGSASGTGSGTGTGTGTGTATGTGTGTGTGGFLGPITEVNLRNGLTNPTAFASVEIGGEPKLFFVDGFRQTNGRLLSLDEDGIQGTDGFPLQTVVANNGSPLTEVLISPFDVVSDGTSLYISTGFGFGQSGAIIRVSNFAVNGNNITARFENITANTAPALQNPAFMTVVSSGSGTFIYWTEYQATPLGQVRRVRTNGQADSDDIIIDNLNFPSGIDHNGTRLAVMDSGGGGGANGQVVLAPINPPLIPLNGSNPNDVTIATPVTGQQPIVRPFDVVYDGERGFFYTEGASIGGTPTVGLGSLGPAAGSVRFIADGESVARIVSNGLNNPAGIDAINTGGNTSSVLFSESAAINGRILRRSVDVTNVTNVAPSVVDTGIDFPLAVGIGNTETPSFVALINYFGGQANGIFRGYTAP